MTSDRYTPAVIVGALAVTIGLLLLPTYFQHVAIEIVILAVAFTGWAMMARFGLISLGHGAFFGIGAYVPALLWNMYGVTPLLGIPIGVVLACAFGLIIAYPCFRLRVVGHYFAIVTLAAGEIIRLGLVAARDVTGGSLGLTINAVGDGNAFYAFQFDKPVFAGMAVAMWMVVYFLWIRVDDSILSRMLHATSNDTQAAEAIGIDVIQSKLKITLTSIAITAVAGAVYAQYKLYINPETVSGVWISLQIVFAAIIGGMYSVFGPILGALLVTTLGESLRIAFGTNFAGAANTIFGLFLIVVIIRLPRGIWGLATRPERSAKNHPNRPRKA
jgi:branched-chain amino acid transport system permease protein